MGRGAWGALGVERGVAGACGRLLECVVEDGVASWGGLSANILETRNSAPDWKSFAYRLAICKALTSYVILGRLLNHISLCPRQLDKMISEVFQL